MFRLNCGAFVEPTQPPSCPNVISASDWSGHSLPSVLREAGGVPGSSLRGRSDEL